MTVAARPGRHGSPPRHSFTYDLPSSLEASEPPEARGLTRDAVRMLVATKSDRSLVPSSFSFLPRFLEAGDTLVVNTSGTIPAAVDVVADDGSELVVHLSTRLDDDRWVVEPRRVAGRSTERWEGPLPSLRLHAAGGAEIVLEEPVRRRRQAVGGDAPPGRAHAQLAGGPRTSHPVRLRHPAVADRDVPERLRHRARKCGDAERRPAVHARGHHPAGGQGCGGHAVGAAYRGRLAGGGRASLSGAGPGARMDGRPGQRRPPRAGTGSSRWGRRWSGPSRPRSGPTGWPTPTTAGPTSWCRRSIRSGSPTACSPAGTSPPPPTC